MNYVRTPNTQTNYIEFKFMIKGNFNFNNKPHYPFTYGDTVEKDGNRIIDYTIKLTQNKKF